MNLDNKTNEELLAMDEAIRRNPKNQLPPTGGWLYTAEARRKLDKIGWAITNNIIEKKKQDGTYVPCDGYSGRKSNRR